MRQEVFPVTVRQQSVTRFSEGGFLQWTLFFGKLLCFNNKENLSLRQFPKICEIYDMVTRPAAVSFILQMTSSFIKVDHSRWSRNYDPVYIQFVSLTFLIMTVNLVVGNILLKWELQRAFPIFWQMSSDKICRNWVAKFLIKGGNFVQIGVSCSRGSPQWQ